MKDFNDFINYFNDNFYDEFTKKNTASIKNEISSITDLDNKDSISTAELISMISVAMYYANQSAFVEFLACYHEWLQLSAEKSL